MAGQPINQLLRQRCLGKGVVGCAEDAGKDLAATDLASVWVDYRNGGPAVVYKALIAGFVDLPHGTLLLLTPTMINRAELRAAVRSLAELFSILLPK